jgi:predicted acetyltransferase
MMTKDKIQLIEPTEALAEEYVAYAEEFRETGDPFVFEELDKANGNMAALLTKWRDYASGRNIPEDYVPGSVYWLVKNGRVLGTCRLRHSLNAKLENFGGHIGYEVRPSERRKGYATELLQQTLQKARERGIRRALVTCDKDNIASARVIQKNGGVLDSEGTDPDNGRVTQRYWITLNEEGSE